MTTMRIRLKEMERNTNFAIALLRDMLDGSEETRGADSEISHIIGVLENDHNHINQELIRQSRRWK